MQAVYDQTDIDALTRDVFTLPTMLLDQSAAMAASERMYANHRAGVRFYSDFRRVISVTEMMALAQTAQADDAADESADINSEEALLS